MDTLTHFANLPQSAIFAHCAAVCAEMDTEAEAESLARDLAALDNIGRARFEFVSDFVALSDVVPILAADDGCFDELPEGPVSIEDLNREAARFITPWGDCRALGFDKPAALLTPEELAEVELRELQQRCPKTWEGRLLSESRRVAKNAEFEARRDAFNAAPRPDFSAPREFAPMLPRVVSAPIEIDQAKLSPPGYVPLNSAKSLTAAQKVARSLNSRPRAAKKATARPVAAPQAAPTGLDASGFSGEAAIARVSAYVAGLIEAHGDRAAKLRKSLDWQVSQVATVLEFHAGHGRDAAKGWELWERGAIAAANAKVVA